eukprot:TCONS_00062179-protein
MIIEDINLARQRIAQDIVTSFKKFLLYGLILTIIVVSGAIVFFYTEQCWSNVPQEYSQESSTQKLCNDILKINETHSDDQNVIAAISNITVSCLKHKNYKQRQKLSDLGTRKTCTLDSIGFAYWMGYVFTIVFTIGYGRVVTNTTAGRALTMVYATISIPIASLTTIYCAKTVDNCVKYMVLMFEQRALKRQKVVWFTRKCACIEMVYLVFMIMFYAWRQHDTILRNYTFFDAVYHVFITVTTIGFGDLDPDQSGRTSQTGVQMVAILMVEIIVFFITFSLMGAFISGIVSTEEGKNNKEEQRKLKSSSNDVIEKYTAVAL